MQYFERLAALPSLAELRSRAAVYARYFRLDRAIRTARSTSSGVLSDSTVTEISDLWGDGSLTASDGYVRTLLAEAQKAHGHVLQCGADLTTLLLALQLERRGVRLWTVENNAHAANTLRSWLAQYELTQAHIIAAPADLTDDGVGYAIDAARLPGPLTLVVCDSSNAHPGSVRRLLPRIKDKLPPNAVALVRNVRRRSDFDYLAEWCRDNEASFVVKGKVDPFAKIVLRDRAAAQAHQADRINTAFAQQPNGVRAMRLATPKRSA
jgi:predicted O-methyltransferase YrrM